MMNRFAILALVSGVCGLLGGCPAKNPTPLATDATSHKAGETERSTSRTPSAHVDGKARHEDVCIGVYRIMKQGGRMYAGTVHSVTVDGRRNGEDSTEWGEIQFGIDRTIAGPPREELNIPYFYVDNRAQIGGAPATVVADWGGGSIWPAPPKRGEHLLLLLNSEAESEKHVDDKLYPLAYRWEVGADDPLVQAFALADEFLATKDDITQDNLFRKLCESPYQNLRFFAQDAAFSYIGKLGSNFIYYSGEGYDPRRQSHLALQYLTYAAPRLSPEERLSLTGRFALWFGCAALDDATDDLKAAFESWYSKEMSIRNDMRYPKEALKGLNGILHAHGSARTLGLFKKTGRDGLLERLRDCARSGDPEVEKLAKELLTKLETQ